MSTRKKQPRAPFAQKKEKEKIEYEDTPIIRVKDVPAAIVIPKSEATKIRLAVPDDATEYHLKEQLRLQRTPEKTVSRETIEYTDKEERLRRVTDPERLTKMPVILGTKAKPVDIEPTVTVTVTKPIATRHTKLEPQEKDDASMYALWREAGRSPPKSDTIHGPIAPPKLLTPTGRSIPTTSKVETPTDLIRRLLQEREDKK